MKFHPFNLIRQHPFNKHTGSISESDRWQEFKNSTADSWGDGVDCRLPLLAGRSAGIYSSVNSKRREPASISKECFCYLIWHSVCSHNVSREQGASIWINMETGGRGGQAEQPKRWLQKQVLNLKSSSQGNAASTWDPLGMCRNALPDHCTFTDGSKLLLISTDLIPWQVPGSSVLNEHRLALNPSQTIHTRITKWKSAGRRKLPAFSILKSPSCLVGSVLRITSYCKGRAICMSNDIFTRQIHKLWFTNGTEQAPWKRTHIKVFHFTHPST